MARLRRTCRLLTASLGLTLLVACRSSDAPARLGVASSLSAHGGIATLVRTIAGRSGSETDLQPLQPSQALHFLAAGDLDAAILESRTDAQAYVARHPESRLVPLWRLRLVLLGPERDPAGVQGLPLTEAFRRIAATRSPFVSLGDRSGVHRREQELWVALGHPRRTGWYHEAGTGARQAWLWARQLGAYILTDAATAAVLGPQSGALRVLATGGAHDSLEVDLVLADGRAGQPVWRTLADALPAAVTALPAGYEPLNPPAAPAASGRSR